jgi:ribonuclease G
MASKQLIINCTPFETRVALLEGSQIVEYNIERTKERGIFGSIYKGKVARVLPGMQSAFVDIGLERAAFLYGGDIAPPESANSGDTQQNADDADDGKYRPAHNFRIEELVREGQEIIVQVAKDSIGTKGARVTSYLSLPGRFVVLMPYMKHIGISRKIQSEAERERLRSTIEQIRPKDVGFVVRTASEGVPAEKLEADVQFLLKLWDSITQKTATQPTPSLVHEDLNLVFRSTRDLLAKDLDRIVVDDKATYDNLVRFLNRFSIKLGAQVHLYEGQVGIFDAYGIELEVNRALSSKVWLKSGGYIVIDETEALVSIDVNTGRFVGHKSLGDTIVKTNLEAVAEIVLQLRLRNIGGIIIIDFIDMDRPDDRERVFQALGEELSRDKSRTSILKISEFGLVQMTRKRTEESLSRKLCAPCPYCSGSGKIKSAASVTYELIRELVREFARQSSEKFVVRAHPTIADRLHEDDREFITDLTEQFSKKLVIKAVEHFHVEKYEITSV